LIKISKMLWIIALAAMSGGASFSQLSAQNITGTWQGTLSVGGRDLRTVFKISTGDDDKLKGLFYSIDQNPQPIAVNPVTVQGTSVKLTIPALGGAYEGKLSADGNSMVGTWTQPGPPPIPMTLNRATTQTAWAIPEPPPPPKPMAADAKPAFEVATIKPSDPARPGKLFTVRGQEVLTINTTLSDLITMAFDLHRQQITGAPAWFESDKFDITGKPEIPGQPNVTQLKIMIQKLLVDRFQLKFHNEKKELSVYAITVAKTGPKLTKSEADPNSLPGLFFGRAAPSGMSFNVRNATLTEVASVLQGSVLDKPVADQTGLSEKYDFTLKFTPDPGQMAGFGGPATPPPAGDSLDAPPDLFTAFQQQLGLKLESTKAPVNVMVIDRVAKPSEN
jgi:uncharacterized protein (TIGR03435 family)